jgi:CheY-like chemotaxis protein
VSAVVVLSAGDESDDKVEALDLGADDYVTERRADANSKVMTPADTREAPDRPPLTRR